MATDTATAHLDDATFADKTGSGVALVDFWAPWCPPCRALGPTIDSLAAEYQGRATIAKVNTDESKRTAAKFGVRSIPTIVFLRDGEEVGRAVGVQPRDKLADMIDQLLGE